MCVSVYQQWFNLYCPTRTNDSHTDEVMHTAESASLQLDVAKVFKGKIDKKSVHQLPLNNYWNSSRSSHSNKLQNLVADVVSRILIIICLSLSLFTYFRQSALNPSNTIWLSHINFRNQLLNDIICVIISLRLPFHIYVLTEMPKSNDSILFCGLCVQETNWQSSHQEEISSDSAAKVSIDHR